MMNTEIRAIKTAAVKYHAEASMTGNSSDHICALLACVETLLAREVEVIELLTQNATFGNIPKSPGVLLNQAHTILNPQPAVKARKAPHDSRGWHPDDEGHG